MKKTIIYCDICGKEDAHTHGFYFGRQLDAAGSQEDIMEYLDLCSEHSYQKLLEENKLLCSKVDRSTNIDIQKKVFSQFERMQKVFLNKNGNH